MTVGYRRWDSSSIFLNSAKKGVRPPNLSRAGDPSQLSERLTANSSRKIAKFRISIELGVETKATRLLESLINCRLLSTSHLKIQWDLIVCCGGGFNYVFAQIPQLPKAYQLVQPSSHKTDKVSSHIVASCIGDWLIQSFELLK